MGTRGRLFKVNDKGMGVQVTRRYGRTRILVCHFEWDPKTEQWRAHYPKDGGDNWRRGKKTKKTNLILKSVFFFCLRLHRSGFE